MQTFKLKKRNKTIIINLTLAITNTINKIIKYDIT